MSFWHPSRLPPKRLTMDWMPDGTSGRLLIAKGSGVDPAYDTIGNADISFGSDTTVSIPSGGSVTISKGLWILCSSSTAGYALYVQVYVYGGWRTLSYGSSYTEGCFAPSDGANTRIYNSQTSTVTAMMRKVN